MLHVGSEVVSIFVQQSSEGPEGLMCPFGVEDVCDAIHTIDMRICERVAATMTKISKVGCLLIVLQDCGLCKGDLFPAA